MKKIILNLFLIVLSFCNVAYADINSVASLKAFIKDGQKNNYFPKTILLNTFSQKNKLIQVDIDFRTVIHWNINSRCPDHEDEIILALGNKNHSIVCNAGDTAGILGTGDNWVEDATGNDIYYPGKGNDTLDTGSGNDILIFDSHWGHDKVTLHSHKVNRDSILGYDGSYPWEYSDFIIFGQEVKREDIVWQGKKLYHLKTGDSIELNTKEVNILFASDPDNNLNSVPTQELIALEDLKSESIFVKDNYLYLAKGNEGLYIVDVKDSSNPVVISKLILPGRARDVSIENNIAYIAQADYYLEGKKGWVSIVDIKDKTSPKLLKTLKFGSAIHSLAVNESVLYIPDTHGIKEDKRALHIYDVSKPAEPYLISTTKQKDFMRMMVYLDKKLYFSDARRLKILDVSNPKIPKIVTNTALHNQKVYSIRVKDDFLVYTHHDHGMSVYHLEKDHTLQNICELKTVKKSKLHEFIHRNTLVIEDDLIYRAEGPKGVSVSSISECKVVNVLPSETKPWTTALIKMDNKLVSFTTGNRGKVYDLKEDMVHIEQQLSSVKKKTSNIVVSNKLSKDQLQTLLYKTVMKNDPEEVKRLCNLGANPNVSGHERYTPVEIAARVGKVMALEALLECGGKPTKKSMFLAALTEQNEAMKVLVKYGVPVTIRDKDDCTTLHFIAQDGSLDMVKYLIEKGVPYNATCRNLESPLTWANYGSNCSVIEYLESLYPPSHKKTENKKCESRKLKEDVRKIKEIVRELNVNKRSNYIDRDGPTDMKIKAIQKGDELRVKFLIKNPMLTEEQATKKRINIDFIEHITLRVGERIVFDMSNSANLSRNPLIIVNTTNFATDNNVTLTITDNHGKKERQSTKIKVISMPVGHEISLENDKVRNFTKSHPKLWKAKTVTDAAETLYGDVAYYEGNFEITMPKIVSNGAAVNIEIKSDLDLESMALLTNANPYSTVAVFSIPKGTKMDYALKFKAKNYVEPYVVIIAKGRDGKFYKTIKIFQVARGGDNCS